MSNKGNIFNNRLVSAAVLVILAVAVLAGYHLTKKDQHVAGNTQTPVHMEPIDSSNCIACHTSEGIMASVVMEVEEGHGGSGG